MTEISDLSQLRAAFPNGFNPETLVSDLQAKGLSLPADFNSSVELVRQNLRSNLTESQKQTRAKALTMSGETRVLTSPVTEAQARKAPGDYDVVVAVDFSVFNSAIKGLYDTRTIPHKVNIPADKIPRFAQTLLLNSNLVFPPGIIAELSQFRITNTPTLEAAIDRDFVRVKIPFVLAFRQVSGNSIDPVQLELRGEISLLVALKIVNIGGNSNNILITLGAPLDVSEPRVRTIDSPIKLASPNALDGLIGLIEFAAWVFELLGFVDVPHLHPVIKFMGASVNFPKIDIRCRKRKTQGDLAMVGFNFLDIETFPDRLSDPFESPLDNTFLQVHEEFLQQAIQTLDMQFFTEKAQEVYSNARIDHVELKFEDDLIKLTLHGQLVDACLFGLVNLPFKADVSVAMAINNDTLNISQKPIERSLDFSTVGNDLRVIACGIGIILEGIIPGIFIGILQSGSAQNVLGGQISDLFSDSPSVDDVTPIEIGKLIPGTELLTHIATSKFSATDGTLSITANTQFVKDNKNTHVYMLFSEHLKIGNPPFGVLIATPISGAKATLFDQDKPAPANDDALDNLRPLEHEVIKTKKFITTTNEVFVPSQFDQKLGSCVTSLEGIAHFVIPSLVTVAGIIRSTTTTKSLEQLGGHKNGNGDGFGTPDDNPEANPTREEKVFEFKPDLYTILNREHNVVLDSRTLQGKGLIVNALNDPKQIGTADDPIEFVLKIDPSNHI